MKKTFVVLAFPMVVATAACTGGGDGDSGPAYPFTSGTYITSNAAVPQDGCGSGDTPADYNGQLSDVVVSGNTVTVNSELTLTKSGNTAIANLEETIDFNGQGADCVVLVDTQILAQVTGTDQASVANTTNVSRVSGADCGGLPVTLPCTTQVTFDITKQ